MTPSQAARALRLTELAVAAFLATASFGAAAQNTPPFKIGLVTDMASGYSDLSGKYSVAAAQMAIEDFGGTVLGRKIELLTADHQLKPTVGSAIVTEWFDRDGVVAIFNITGSSVALAANAIAKDRPTKAIVNTSASSTDLNGKACLPNAIHWAADFYAYAYSTAKYMSQGSKTWYVMLQDTAAGPPARAAALAGIQKGGGKMVGEVKVPTNSGDVSSFVLQAQASKAQNIILGFGANDAVNIIKSSKQFGLQQSGITFVQGAGMYQSDINAMGLDLASGVTFVTPFYSEMNDEARAWSRRFFTRTGKYPSFSHVADYEGVTHYLKAVQKVGSDDATKVIPAMREIPVNSFALKNARIRENNQLIRPMYLGRVKTAAQSKNPGDFVDLIATIPAEEAYSLIENSECPLVKK
ncbi:MAG: ABC transporter substrate-binding protein [Pseudomonadota bacterium]